MMQDSWDAVLLSAVVLIAVLDGSSGSLADRNLVTRVPGTNINVNRPVNSCRVPENLDEVEVKGASRRQDAERCERRDNSARVAETANP